MGKSITDAEAAKARAQLANCRAPGCSNSKSPGEREGGYCKACRAAYKTVKEYGRTHRAQPE